MNEIIMIQGERRQCLLDFYRFSFEGGNTKELFQEEGDEFRIRRPDKLGDLLFAALEKNLQPMEDLFRIELIPFPKIKIQKKLKLFRGGEREEGEAVPFPRFFNGQKNLELRKLLNELLRVF